MTPAEKDAAVRKAITNWPRLTPSDIRQLTAISTDSVRRSLKRIGAVRHPGGRYSAPPVPAAAAERPTALPDPAARLPVPAPFVCNGRCHRLIRDYRGSRASGDGRKCRACVEAP